MSSLQKKNELYFYPKISDLREGTWDQQTIRAYYTFGSGQTVVHLDYGDFTAQRVSKDYFRDLSKGRSCFEVFPSLSTISSAKKCFRWMMDNKYIAGENNLSAFEKLNQEELMTEGLTTEHRFLNSRIFKKWHKKIRDQIIEIKSDKSDFKTESIKTESVNMIKQTIRYIQHKYNWNAADLKEIVDESAREFLIQDVIDN